MNLNMFKSWILLVLKGMGMGAADVVPGVSGGTIAFITGIYEKLIYSLKSINAKAMQILFKEGFGHLWSHVNGNFLVAVFAGILISIFTLASVLERMLENNPILVWSFFFGLILSSVVFISNKIKLWDFKKVIALLAGIGIAYLITQLTPATTTEALWFVFLSGVVAICAMILPGISGAFILLLMGKYQFILEAVNELNLIVLGTFAIGAVVGLLSFSHLLGWLLKHFHDITISALAGIMIGSLFKIWPWKHTVSTFTDRHGETQPLVQENVLPTQFEALTGSDPQLWPALGWALAGILLIFLVEWISKDKKTA